MNNTLSEKITLLQNQMLSKLTKNKIENEEINFNIPPTINGSQIFTLNLIKNLLTISSEDTSVDFSQFGLKWDNVSTLIASSISVSEVGKYQILASVTGNIYISINYGNFFSHILQFDGSDDIFNNMIYTGVAVSLTGQYFTAIGPNGIIISTDYGNSWNITNRKVANWISICITADGKTQYAVNNIGTYTSKDYGNSWSFININTSKIICSIGGYYLIALSNIISFSINGGITFIDSDSPNKIWNSISCSATGQYLTAVTDGDYIYTSNNYGLNWLPSQPYFNGILTSVSITGSGKYQLIGGTGVVYISKDFGQNWISKPIDGTQISCISLSFNGKIAMLSCDAIFTSEIMSIYIKEVGSDTFKPLNNTTFCQSFKDLSINIDLTTELSNYSSVIAISSLGQYQTIVVNGGNIWTSNDFGLTFNFNPTIGSVDLWSGIAISSSGEYQIAITSDGKIFISSSYGVLFIPCNTIITNGLNTVVISSSGQYQSICCNSGIILYSLDYGSTWDSSNISNYDLLSITMSSNGKYQSVCGLNNTVMYSKTYGVNWTISTLLTDISTKWNSISCSDDGQLQILAGNETNIYFSEDGGINWRISFTSSKEWTHVFVTHDGQRQLACDNGGSLWVSLNFGKTWNSCPGTTYNFSSICVSKTLQYIVMLYSGGIITSFINNKDIYGKEKIPGILTINTDSQLVPGAVILLSGSNNNIYSYKISSGGSFNILSSDVNDNGAVSYEIINYGQVVNP
jgi:photosystem II stability/assembly factor-like uncharacterized protein